MGSKLQTGLLLTLGPIVALIGWMGLYPAGNETSTVVMAQKIMDDPVMAQMGITLGYGGMIALAMGLFFTSRGIATGDGSGRSYTNISQVLFVTIIPIMLMSAGFEFANTEAATIAEGALMQNLALATSSSFGLAVGLGVLLLGVAIVLEKIQHIIVGMALSLVGIILPISSLIGENGDVLQMVGWMGYMATGLILGVLTIRDSRNS
jgi:hypothetical protein